MIESNIYEYNNIYFICQNYGLYELCKSFKNSILTSKSSLIFLLTESNKIVTENQYFLRMLNYSKDPNLFKNNNIKCGNSSIYNFNICVYNTNKNLTYTKRSCEYDDYEVILGECNTLLKEVLHFIKKQNVQLIMIFQIMVFSVNNYQMIIQLQLLFLLFLELFFLAYLLVYFMYITNLDTRLYLKVFIVI